MEREDTVIDFGDAAVETKGSGLLIVDDQTRQSFAGLSDD